MEDGIHYFRRIIQTDSDVFQINKFIYDIPDYDELVEEVVKRLAENNLYIKLEKCK